MFVERKGSGLTVVAENGASSPGAILVTGGAGYIGSHVVRQLQACGEPIVVLDNLSNGSRKAVRDAVLHEGDIHNYSLLESIIRAHKVSTVIHFAAAAVVSESAANPAKYYRNNTGGTAILLQCAVANKVRHFVFSSTAAVYGAPKGGICRETSPANPVNPYGRSKLMCEEMLRDISNARSMRHVILRYFNVAGAAAGGAIGQRGKVSTHITKIACEVVTGRRKKLEIFGTDYPTQDGTCIRDYLHVEDLAAAHLAALEYLRDGGESTTLNCGYGRGFSVREIVAAVERAAGKSLAAEEAGRRPGDPPILVAAPDRIAQVLDWSPKFDDLDVIARSALAWERTLGLVQ